ncbi:MAG: hypothetical protein II336_18145 [Loktanella sp.]|nr:hypothetical protein [Loktanella sp.]
MSEAQKSLARASKQFAAVAGAATVAFASVTAAALKGAKAIDENAKAARRLDSSVAGFRALEMAADDAGVSLSSLADNVQTMNREIAKNSQGAQDALRRIGIAASDLNGLDADQKLAIIADQVQGLGLNSAEASALLQQLGVRNREMALLVTQGGDALRAARVDVEQFGLAISDVDAARIEAANDELAGLADITTYIGDQLALKFVPAMGDMAKAMTDSLREGGALRRVLDGLIGSLDRIGVYIGVIVTGFGVRYVAALAAARFATLSLVGALAALRTAIIRTGIGVLVVGAGELVLWLGRVIERVGGVGNAFKLLAAQAQASAAAMKSWFLRGIADIVKGFEDMTWAFARGFNGLFGANLQGMSGSVFTSVNNSAREAMGAANAARVAVDDLRDSIAETGDTATDTGADVSDSMDAIADAADDVGGAGRGAGRAIRDGLQPAIPVIEEATSAFQDMVSQGVDSLAGAFGDFISNGLRDFQSFAGSILDTFKRMISQMIATSLANPIKIALGMGGSVAGTAAQAGTGLLGGGGLLAGAGALAGGVGTGLTGVLGGGGIGAGISGGLAAGGAAGIGAALGAAIPILAPLAIGAMLFGRRRRRRQEREAAAQAAQQRAAEEAQRQAVIADQSFGLEVRNLELSGRGAEALAMVREREIAAIDASLQPLARLNFQLEDAARVAGERFGLETRLLQLQGDTAALRERELQGVDALNRGLLEQIFSFEDAADAMAEVNRRLESFTANSSNFATLADQTFAASQVGNQRSINDMEITQALMKELIRAVREGDQNNGRLTSQLVAIQQRGALAPT